MYADITVGVPPCMEKVGDGAYKCSKFGFIIRPKTSKIYCDGCVELPAIVVNEQSGIVHYEITGAYTKYKEQPPEETIHCPSGQLSDAAHALTSTKQPHSAQRFSTLLPHSF